MQDAQLQQVEREAEQWNTTAGSDRQEVAAAGGGGDGSATSASASLPPTTELAPSPSTYSPKVDESGEHHWEEPSHVAQLREEAVSAAVASANAQQSTSVADWVHSVEASGVRLTGKELWQKAPERLSSSWRCMGGADGEDGNGGDDTQDTPGAR